MNIPEDVLNKLTDDQKKRIEAAKTPEELLAIAKETGYELTDEQMERISGGIVVPPCVPDSTCSNDCKANEWW